MSDYERVKEAAAAVADRAGGPLAAAVVLGSGLGGFTAALREAISIPYANVPGFPPSAIVGHDGRLVIGSSGGRRIAALSGRCHAYEGHDLGRVTFAVRTMALLGVRVLVITNAAGGINTGFSEGALMVIDDHINLTGGNPLVGPHDERFGPRFPDMTHVYSPRLRRIADEAGAAAGVALAHGVYVGLLGPSFETPAEIRYLRTIGADAVGFSTVAEAIAARHMGVEVLGISCITNMAAGVLPAPLSHEEVLATTERVRDRFIALLEEIVGRL